MSKGYIYKHLNVKAFTMRELIEKLNQEGKDGWMLVSHGKTVVGGLDTTGYASIILCKEIEVEKQTTKPTAGSEGVE